MIYITHFQIKFTVPTGCDYELVWSTVKERRPDDAPSRQSRAIIGVFLDIFEEIINTITHAHNRDLGVDRLIRSSSNTAKLTDNVL